MLPYAGRCPCRATTPRRARGRDSPAAARSRRSPSCSRRPSPTPSRRASAASAASTPATATGASGAWPGCRMPWPPIRPACSTRTSSSPHRDTLAYSENNIVAGVLGLPAYLLTGNPYATHNLSMLLGIGLAFVGAYALARYLTQDTGASIVAAIGFAFCPFLFARTAHIQLMLFFGLPIAMLAMHRLVDAPSAGRGVAPRPGPRGAGAGLRLLRHLRRAADRARPAVLRGDARPAGARPRYWLCGAIAAATAIAPVLPFFLPYVRVQGELGFTRSVEEAAYYSADLQAWLASSAWAHRWYPAVARPLERGAVPRRPDAGRRPLGRGTRLAGGVAPATAPATASVPDATARPRPGTCWPSTASAACSRSGSRSGRPPASIACCSR